MAGKHIPLYSEFRSNTQCSVKIVLKDLPLHMLNNSQVLDAMMDQYEAVLEVFYGTLWQDNQLTSIRNGDRFFYVLEGVVSTLPDTIMVAGMPARLFKPRAMATCKRCKQTGHIARDSQCPAKAPAAMAESIEPFRGSANPLSNLHSCPEGCVIPDGQHDFPSAEQYYQFKRLCFHSLFDKSYRVLEANNGFEAMKLAHEALPDDKVKAEWKEIMVEEMLETNRLKYTLCDHACKALLSSKVVLAEATSNLFWGTGLPPELTRHTLSDYWPGENHMGKVLAHLCEDLIKTGEGISEKDVDTQKHKASSPLLSTHKSAKI